MFLEPDINRRWCLKNIVLVQPVTDDFNRVQIDIFKKIWIRLLKKYDDKKGNKMAWPQSLDSIFIKSSSCWTITDNSPVNRSKLGTKRHILTDKKGMPLSIVITSAASPHDIKVVTDVIDAVVIKLPAVTTFLSITKARRRIKSSTYALIKHTILNP